MSIARLEHVLFVEQIRATVLDAIRRFGHTRLSIAEEAGVSPRVLAALLAGADPHPKHLRLLYAWCERWGALGTWPEHAALALLVSVLPVDKRLQERAALAEWLAGRLAAAGRLAPDWIIDELDDCRYLTRTRREQDRAETINPTTSSGQHA
jgi:hypothetical protein